MDTLGKCNLDGGWISSLDSLVTSDLNVQKKSNDHLAELADKYPGRISGLCTVNPSLMNDAVEEIYRCANELRLIGIKLHPWLQAFNVTSNPGMRLIMKAAEKLNMFVLFHDGTPPYSTPLQIAFLAEQFPAVPVILGHSGLLDLYPDAALAAEQNKNIWLQPTSAPPIAIRSALKAAGPSRLLFGSDGGFGSEKLIQYNLDKFSDSLGNETLNQILSKNPSKFIRSKQENIK